MRITASLLVCAIVVACGASDSDRPKPNPGPSDASTDGEVCAPKNYCGQRCCASNEVCAFQRCLVPGNVCVDSADCPANQYCDYVFGESAPAPQADAACVGGASVTTGRCLPRPSRCEPDAGTQAGGDTLPCLEKCEYRPPPRALSPVVKYAWGGQIASPFSTDVMMTPIVVQLDDDNCDGKVNEQDIPEIVLTTFSEGKYTELGTLHAISIVKGAIVEKWSRAGEVNAGGQLAGGNIDGQPGNEVVGCAQDGSMRAFRGDGSTLWTSEEKVGCAMPALADLDGDGKVEIVAEGWIVEGATGKTKKKLATVGYSIVSDVDGDGKLDIVTASQAFTADGTLLVDTTVPGSFSAIGDFDVDGKPEIVAVDSSKHLASIWRYDAASPQKFTWVRQNIDINANLTQHCADGTAGYTNGGGPPTVADFDGDGKPDVALAGGVGYTILSGAKIVDGALAANQTTLWSVPTTDCSSAATGSSVFDFDGDGKAEVVYSDEQHLRIYEGPTGKVLFEMCNTTGTLIEYPVIADVDNDGHADIVVVSNSYGNATADYQCADEKGISQAGVRILGDAQGSWVRTRRVWNQHAYHITNVNEDGSIPASELPNWKQPGLNNFRQNKAPGLEFAAPDAIVTLLRPECGQTYALVANVTNAGEAALPAGIPVGFYTGTPPTGTLLGTVSTTRVLLPAQSEDVTLPLPNPRAGLKEGSLPIYAIVDDGSPAHPSWHECRPDNNVATAASGSCSRNIR